MIKNGKFIPCVYCDKVSIKDTDPPVCEEHRHKLEELMQKKAAVAKLGETESASVKTLKELESL